MENNYKPEKILNTTLENGEIHFCSFAVMPYSKDIVGHSPNLDTYTMHLTDKRLIVEPDINTEFLEKFYKVINLIPLEGVGVHFAKSMNKEAIKRMNYLKYTYIAISYQEIESFKFLSASFNTNLVQIFFKNGLVQLLFMHQGQ